MSSIWTLHRVRSDCLKLLSELQSWKTTSGNTVNSNMMIRSSLISYSYWYLTISNIFMINVYINKPSPTSWLHLQFHWSRPIIPDQNAYSSKCYAYGPGGGGKGGSTLAKTHKHHFHQHATKNNTGRAEWVRYSDRWKVSEWIRVLVVIWVTVVEVSMSLDGERSMKCGHAMRHSELETTVRAPAMKGWGLPLFLVASLLGLGVEVTIFGIVVSFCQFWTTVLTKNGDFFVWKKIKVKKKSKLP